MKLFKYNSHNLIIHTFSFILILIPISVILSPDEKYLNFILISAIFLGIYLIYILIGYFVLFTNYLEYINNKDGLVHSISHNNVFRAFLANSGSAFYAFSYGLINNIFFFITGSSFYAFVMEIYYAIALIKCYMVLNINKFDIKKEKIDKSIIVFLFVLSFAVLLCSISIFNEKGTFTKYDFLINAYAVYAIYALISGIVLYIFAYIKKSIIRTRFFIIKLGSSIFSLFVLYVALQNKFSNGDIADKYYMLLDGILSGLIIFIFGSILLIRNIKNHRININNV